MTGILSYFRRIFAESLAEKTDYTPHIGDLAGDLVKAMRETGKSPCHHATLVYGPRGGGSQNVWCVVCHSRYNIPVDFPVDWGECTDVNDDIGYNWWVNR